ncbi:MAG TPA: hypothetical protein VIF62_39590, partial [Labilithrix sp.]
YPHRLRIAGETIYFTFGDAFEALPLAGGSPRVVRRVDPASVLWLGTAWLLGADERGIYVCDYWAKKPSGPVACSLTLTAPDGSPLGYLVDPAAGFQKYLYDADVFATDDRYAYWTQLDDGAGPDDPQPANALVRVPKTGGTPCVVDARTTRQFAVDETRITYATSGGISMRRKLL